VLGVECLLVKNYELYSFIKTTEEKLDYELLIKIY